MHSLAPDIALEREHREIDAGIEAFVDRLGEGEVRPRLLETALDALRRHIYLEEVLMFPPIREAGLVMPIFVMMREHGEMWRTMDALRDLLAAPADVQRLADGCAGLLAQLQQHNSKEEPVVYPHVETALPAQTKAELSRFIETGRTPEGWVCQHARE
ncbi:hemerythrin domain-containing protein [Mycolicibacterium sp. XJ1819]